MDAIDAVFHSWQVANPDAKASISKVRALVWRWWMIARVTQFASYDLVLVCDSYDIVNAMCLGHVSFIFWKRFFTYLQKKLVKQWCGLTKQRLIESALSILVLIVQLRLGSCPKEVKEGIYIVDDGAASQKIICQIRGSSVMVRRGGGATIRARCCSDILLNRRARATCPEHRLMVWECCFAISPTFNLLYSMGRLLKKLSYVGALFGLMRTPIRLHESDGFLGRLGASSPVLSGVSQAEDRWLCEFVRIFFPFPTFFFYICCDIRC